MKINVKNIFLNGIKMMFTAFLVTAIAGCVSSGSSGPVKENTARENKELLLKYLNEMQGKGILAGQMDNAWNDTIDTVKRVFKDTGRYPAIKGFDYLNIRRPETGGGGSKQTAEAIEWWKNSPVRGKNGIVTFCWHWRMPITGTDRTGRDNYSPGFVIPFKDGKLDQNDPKFALIMEDLNLVAAELGKLRDAGVPVLWRPLHEASNINGRPGWFWWGANRESYLALWAFMHDYFTNEKGLDNLIWVWNGQNKNWYPGPETVDIAGYDAYDGNRDSPGYKPDYRNTWQYYYESIISWAPGKPAALTENGSIPDPDHLIREGTNWIWFMTWDDHSVVEGYTDKNNHWTGEYHNTNAHKRHVYRHRYVITLNELPAFSR